MKRNKHIEDVLETFYLTTNTPVQAYEYQGYLIDSNGFNQVHERIFDNADIYKKVRNKLIIKREIVNIKTGDDIYFTACTICPRTIHRGIFIIGPYSHKKDNQIGLAYKPGDINKHLVSFLRILYNDSSCKPMKNVQDIPYSLHIKKAIDFIDARYTDDISLDHISEYLDINKSYFCTLFKEETDMTFTEYLNKVRIDKSKELLLETDMPILDIALAVGFNNQNYYNIVFKRLSDETPLNFRHNGIITNDDFICPAMR